MNIFEFDGEIVENKKPLFRIITKKNKVYFFEIERGGNNPKICNIERMKKYYAIDYCQLIDGVKQSIIFF